MTFGMEPEGPGLRDTAELQEAFRQEEGMLHTHHAPGSAEERHSRRVRFDKYYAMQQLLNRIANCSAANPFPLEEMHREAKDILAGMVRPTTPWQRAAERAVELEALAYAYRVLAGTVPEQGPIVTRAATLTIEALKAWERAHPPAALDPLLL